jgi:hypothetical protein
MSHARRLPSMLRLLLLGAMMSGLALQPVLAALGELHARAHDPSGRHPLAAQLDVPSGEAFHDHQSSGHSSGEAHDDHSPGREGADPLHALIHLAHCCGQSLAVLPSPLLVVAHSPHGTLSMPGPQIHSQALSLAPFRPPIAA